MSALAATQFEKERGVTQIRVMPGIVHLRLRLPSGSADALPELRALADANVPVFLVKLIPDGLSLAVRDSHFARCEALLKQRERTFVSQPEMALVSVIAGAMRDLSGIMAEIYEALQNAHVAIRQTGDRYDAVHILVAGSDAEKAREALATRFQEWRGP